MIQPRVSREAFVEAMEGCIDADTRAEGAEPGEPGTPETGWTSGR